MSTQILMVAKVDKWEFATLIVVKGYSELESGDQYNTRQSKVEKYT